MSDWWANDPVESQAPARPAAPAPAGNWWANDPIVPAEKPGVIEDVAKSGASGLARGALGLLGLPGTLVDLGRTGVDWAADQTVGRAVNYARTGSFDAPQAPPTRELLGQQGLRIPDPGQVISGAAITDLAAKAVPGVKYEPQTTAGEYARTIGEFAPGVLMPGTMAQRVVGGVLAPAIASETAGQATKGTSLETPARIIAGVGAGLGAAALSRPSTAQAAVAGSMGGLDDAMLSAAGDLMKQAQQRGVALTWPEAISQVSGGGATGLTGLQRVVEGSAGGQGVMGPYMAQRPAQVDAAARQAFDTVAPPTASPSMIGREVGAAAQSTVDDVTAAINRATRPAYDAAKAQTISAADQAALMADPLYSSVLKEVRSNPALNRMIADLPDDTVGVIDMVQRRMRESADNAAIPGQASSGNTIAANYSDARSAPIAAAERATGSAPATATAPAQVGSYEAARQQQAAARQKYLEPLMAGPIGKLAEKNLETSRAIEVLFPRNPLPGSAPEVLDAVTALAKRNPTAARQLVRAHAESVFNQASRDLQAGATQYGGAGFAAALKGNTQQAENLAAAIQGVAGPEVLKGFDAFLDVMSATGQRQRIGSQTAFNQEAQGVLRRGGAVGEVANTVATAGVKLPARITEAYQQWRLGKNTEQIAQMFTNPEALGLLRRLASEAPGSSRGQAIGARLVSLVGQSFQSLDNRASK